MPEREMVPALYRQPYGLDSIATGIMLPRTERRPAIYGLPFTYLHEFAPLGSGAVASRDSFTIDGGVEHFALHRLAALADDYGATLQLEATPVDESLLRTPAFLSNFGSGIRPTVFIPPARLPARATLTAVMSDRKSVAAANNIRIAYHGAKMYGRPFVPVRVYRWAKPFFHTANFTANDGGRAALGANGSDAYSLLVDPGSDFEIQRLTVVSDGPCTLVIQTDSHDWSNEPIRSELYGGSLIETPATPSGMYPWVLPVPKLVGPAGYIAVTVADVSGAANRVHVIFHGLRLYP